jgi:hypothetical protein
MTKILILILSLIFLSVSCIRNYEVNFKYTVTGTQYSEGQCMEGHAVIPSNSGNFTINVYADVPKQIDISPEVQIPLVGGM